MNIQDQSVAYNKKLLERAEEMKVDTSKIPSVEITKLCRMIAMYCESEGKVSESFKKAMDVCVKQIIAVEGMEDIVNEFKECPR